MNESRGESQKRARGVEARGEPKKFTLPEDLQTLVFRLQPTTGAHADGLRRAIATGDTARAAVEGLRGAATSSGGDDGRGVQVAPFALPAATVGTRRALFETSGRCVSGVRFSAGRFARRLGGQSQPR